jgi:hypothetical protein
MNKRVALIVGAGPGISAAFGEALVADGYQVALASRARRYSRWGSLRCGDSLRVSLGSWVPREFMWCISSLMVVWFRAAKLLMCCRRKRSRGLTWLRWRNRLALGVGSWNCAVILSRSD